MSRISKIMQKVINLYENILFFLGPTTMMSEGTKNILEAMKTHNVQRVSCCISCKFSYCVEIKFYFHHLSVFIIRYEKSANYPLRSML